MGKYGKFAALAIVIVGSLVWLAAGGIKENSTYYKTISEVKEMGDQALGKRLRLAGDVEAGSIVRKAGAVDFVLVQEKLRISVS
jgi:cytochrome c-type biogenesis protein CcmE